MSYIGLMFVVFLMSLNSTAVLSKNTAQIYAAPTVFTEVLSNQLGNFTSKLYNLCISAQYLILPVLYLMIIVYQVNFIIFDDAEQKKNIFISLSAVSALILIIFCVFFGNIISKVSWANTGSFLLLVSFLIYVSIKKVFSNIKEMRFGKAELSFKFEDGENCSAKYFGENIFLNGDISYLLSIWILMFNIISYSSNCNYNKSQKSGFTRLLLLLFLLCVAIAAASLPIMACNPDSQKVVFTN